MSSGKSIVVTTRLDTGLVEQLDALAARTGRSRAAVLAEAARDYAEDHASFLAFVDAGERDIDEGRFMDVDETRAWLSGMMADAQARMDRQKAA